METVTEKPEEELGLFITGNLYMCCIFSVIKNKTVEWAIVVSAVSFMLLLSYFMLERQRCLGFLGCAWRRPERQ